MAVFNESTGYEVNVEMPSNCIQIEVIDVLDKTKKYVIEATSKMKSFFFLLLVDFELSEIISSDSFTF